MSKKAYTVRFTEMDSWSGSESWVKGFKTEKEAKKAVEECNSKNTSTCVPDYYVIAEYLGEIELIL